MRCKPRLQSDDIAGERSDTVGRWFCTTSDAAERNGREYNRISTHIGYEKNTHYTICYNWLNSATSQPQRLTLEVSWVLDGHWKERPAIKLRRLPNNYTGPARLALDLLAFNLNDYFWFEM